MLTLYIANRPGLSFKRLINQPTVHLTAGEPSSVGIPPRDGVMAYAACGESGNWVRQDGIVLSLDCYEVSWVG
ncbi:hypothetical protein AG1IA_08019 [Rhizoctonia solani AG-1 IA]|uniref:Uncharacterized protein n=1 Tax=Thanatephorus cucumeris (strain AG1-IA) TaxID=983506 RepID=L8WNL8_THACA|nr:hypothetical protein AG1IA_08019 [Rhizoctonia solani AG-1 IA]